MRKYIDALNKVMTKVEHLESIKEDISTALGDIDSHLESIDYLVESMNEMLDDINTDMEDAEANATPDANGLLYKLMAEYNDAHKGYKSSMDSANKAKDGPYLVTSLYYTGAMYGMRIAITALGHYVYWEHEQNKYIALKSKDNGEDE